MIDVIFSTLITFLLSYFFMFFENEPRETYVHGPKGSHQLTNAANDIYKS